MATYTKETALYDTNAIADDISTAGETASKFLSADSTGIMVYDGTNGVQTPSNPSSTTNNVFIDDNSLDIREGTTVLAMFGSDGAQIGQNVSGSSRAVISEDGMQIYRKTSNGDVQIVNLGYGEGINTVGDENEAPYYTLGIRNSTATAYDSTATYKVGDLCVYDSKVYVCKTKIQTAEAWTPNHWQLAIGNFSYAEGKELVASGYCAHAEGLSSSAIGQASHAEGGYTHAYDVYSHAEGSSTYALGYCSHAEGSSSHAEGQASHAEGMSTKAYKVGSHAEGDRSIADGPNSHAEGVQTKTVGEGSHTEGYKCYASGNYSHAQNEYTETFTKAQTVIGRYNIKDRGNVDELGQYALIIGNGTQDTALVVDRSNALTVDWQGRVECGDHSGVLKSIFDIFYPVGSYYETSDANFDPNVVWGGTWIPETEGQVHVSAGSTYTVSGAATNTSDGGAATVKLTDAQIAHGHGFTQPKIPNHTHTLTYNSDSGSAASGSDPSGRGAFVRRTASGGETSSWSTNSTGGGGACTGGAVSNLSGASSTRTAHDNMPPYIVVYRWHRTR